MGRYKNVILLALMLVMAVFIATAVSGITNTLLEEDNRQIAADTCGVTVQIMEARDDQFVINMVNSAQYRVDCLGENFILQKLVDGEENAWETVETDPMGAEQTEEITYEFDLPSGENRAFYWKPKKDGETVLSEGTYRICKDIYRKMEEDNDYSYLTLTVQFDYPQVLEQTRAFGKPVESAEVAAKLARTMTPEVDGMQDYWNPTVTEQEDSWLVSFPLEDGDFWTVTVSKENGSIIASVVAG